MPIVPAAPPQAVPLTGGFDHVTVDSVRLESMRRTEEIACF